MFLIRSLKECLAGFAKMMSLSEIVAEIGRETKLLGGN